MKTKPPPTCAARATILLRQYGHQRLNLRRKFRRLVSQNFVLVKQHLGDVSSGAGVGLQDRIDAQFKLWLLDAVNVFRCVFKKTGVVAGLAGSNLIKSAQTMATANKVSNPAGSG